MSHSIRVKLFQFLGHARAQRDSYLLVPVATAQERSILPVSTVRNLIAYCEVRVIWIFDHRM
jgi:hypothetical protein